MREKINMFAYENKMICFESNSIDVNLRGESGEIKQDIILEEKAFGKIWGYVLDKFNRPIEGVKVTLLKREYINKRQDYTIVDAILSDKDGLYQFELEEVYKDIEYIVNIDKV
ncbi:carboxypeptidase-like regulatory domain-containing protein [Paraclostridium dentum]|uniref:carboxypeptidase-like regulatory domain-containing protein n=1 Tax=Paraclostridium dentum TaxID=2662455 RepID=UPI003F3AE8A3